jgi:hypothetical protein
MLITPWRDQPLKKLQSNRMIRYKIGMPDQVGMTIKNTFIFQSTTIVNNS